MSPFPIPLNAIRAIEIVARRGALAPAAEELGVTPGAVSQHLRRAEERLGVELFERTPQGLRPRPALVQILPQLSAGFSALADALKSLRPAEDNVLTLTVGAVFASRWLIWRMARFTAAHPEIELRLVVSAAMVDFAHSDIDCGVRFGRGPWPGVVAERIGGQHFQPVATPALAARIRTPGDLAKVPVIHDTSTMLPWSKWFASVGAPMVELTGPSISDPALAFDAAISGQGVLLTVDMMAADAVRDGRLVWPFGRAVESELGYWMVRAEGRRMPDKVRMFRDWLLAEAAEVVDGQGRS
ncbi:LysR substrate-binding domain-containing protein [Devosia sp.]|uniref:LysR substrate-binding domain-containing protein n=1 Tax=Devosia sp. TaxID=1871048 RepID=UPI003BAA6214